VIVCYFDCLSALEKKTKNEKRYDGIETENMEVWTNEWMYEWMHEWMKK